MKINWLLLKLRVQRIALEVVVIAYCCLLTQGWMQQPTQCRQHSVDADRLLHESLWELSQEVVYTQGKGEPENVRLGRIKRSLVEI